MFRLPKNGARKRAAHFEKAGGEVHGSTNAAGAWMHKSGRQAGDFLSLDRHTKSSLAPFIIKAG